MALAVFALSRPPENSYAGWSRAEPTARHGTAPRMDDRPRNLRSMLSEAKDTSELMVDLAYAALYFGDPDMAEEVRELEEQMNELVHDMRAVSVLAARNPREAEAMASVFREAARVLRDRRYLAVYVSDSWRKRGGGEPGTGTGLFMPIGFEFSQKYSVPSGLSSSPCDWKGQGIVRMYPFAIMSA